MRSCGLSLIRAPRSIAGPRDPAGLVDTSGGPESTISSYKLANSLRRRVLPCSHVEFQKRNFGYRQGAFERNGFGREVFSGAEMLSGTGAAGARIAGRKWRIAGW